MSNKVILFGIYGILLPFFMLFIAALSNGYDLVGSTIFGVLGTLPLIMLYILYAAACDIYGTLSRKNNKSIKKKKRKRGGKK